jgi:chromosome segregation ATPase
MELNEASVTFAKALAHHASLFLKDELENTLNRVLQHHLQPFATQLGEVVKEVKDLKSDVGDLKSEVGNLKSEVGNLKNDVGDLKSEVGNLKSEVGNLKSEVGNLKSEVGNLKSEVNKMKSEIDEVKQQANTLTQRFDKFIDFQLKSLKALQTSSSPSPSQSPVSPSTDFVMKSSLAVVRTYSKKQHGTHRTTKSNIFSTPL